MSIQVGGWNMSLLEVLSVFFFPFSCEGKYKGPVTWGTRLGSSNSGSDPPLLVEREIVVPGGWGSHQRGGADRCLPEASGGGA